MAYDFVRTSSQYLSVQSAPTATVPCTMAARFNANGTSSVYWLVGLGNSTVISGQFRGIILRGDLDDTVRAFEGDSVGSASANSPNAFSSATWEHASAIFSTSTSRTVYLSGGAAGTNNTSISPTGLDRFAIAGLLRQTVNADYFDGRICDVALWNVALNASEISSLSKGFKAYRIRPQSLVFYAPLIRNIQDTKGGVTITNNNSATVANHPRVI